MSVCYELRCRLFLVPDLCPCMDPDVPLIHSVLAPPRSLEMVMPVRVLLVSGQTRSMWYPLRAMLRPVRTFGGRAQLATDTGFGRTHCPDATFSEPGSADVYFEFQLAVIVVVAALAAFIGVRSL